MLVLFAISLSSYRTLCRHSLGLSLLSFILYPRERVSRPRLILFLYHSRLRCVHVSSCCHTKHPFPRRNSSHLLCRRKDRQAVFPESVFAGKIVYRPQDNHVRFGTLSLLRLGSNNNACKQSSSTRSDWLFFKRKIIP